MSHIGKKPIEVPEGVKVEIKGQNVRVEGDKGKIAREIRREVKVEKKEGRLLFSLRKENNRTKAFWGTERSLVKNMIQGAKDGFERRLRLEGIGYRAKMDGNKLILEVGFSHDVEMIPPEGVEISVKGKIIIVSGIDKQKVNQTGAKIRRVRKPDPYTGKGIRYEGEEIKLKPGKKAIGSEA